MRTNLHFRAMARVALLALLLLLPMGCRQDELVEAPLPHEGERVEVSLRLHLTAPDAPQAEGVQTRTDTLAPGGAAFSVRFGQETSKEALSLATRATPAALYNLWAFQFTAGGAIVGSPQRVSNSQTAAAEGANLSVSLTVGRDQTLYLVSAGKKITTDLSTVKTLDELKASKLDYLLSEKGGYTSGIVQPEDIPYGGFVAGVNVVSLGEGAGTVEYNTPEGFMGNIQLGQLVSKVTLRYKFEVDTHTLQGVRLQNAPAQLCVDGSNSKPATAAEVRNLDLRPGGTPDKEGYYTASWYVAPNKQGEVPTIALEQDRFYNKTTQQGNAPRYGLNVEVLGKKNETGGTYSVYQIFVGKNNTSNFDVEANHNYTLTTAFNSFAQGTDPRLDETTFSTASLEFRTSQRLTTTEGLCKSPSGTTYDLDAHYDYRPLLLEVSGRKVDIGIYTNSACTVLASMNESNWLRLSSEPNYTLAVNNLSAPLTNRIVMEARTPAKLSFYLYNDEYVTKRTDALKRSLYVKVTTTELDVATPQSTVDRFQIDQRPILLCGRFGGTLADGEYSQLMGVDQIDEQKIAYYEGAATATSGLYWGYAPYATGYAPDKDNGREATVRLAGNPESKPFDLEQSPPRYVAGKLDLYQYGYANAYVARFCYDRNRDLDGSGALERVNSRGEDEIRWYLPAIRQLMGMYAQRFTSTGYLLSATDYSGYPYMVSMYEGRLSTFAINEFRFRCVRDIAP